MNESLDIFFGDFGVPVVFGGVTDVGLFDMPDQTVDSISISTGYSVLVKAALFSTVKFGDTGTVNGVTYKVKSFAKLDDGAIARITLETP